jgi:ankyrin repeat protein
MTASYYGNKSLVRLLLEYNVNYNSVDSNGRAAWEIAQEMKHYGCTELLLNEMGKF